MRWWLLVVQVLQTKEIASLSFSSDFGSEIESTDWHFSGAREEKGDLMILGRLGKH